MPSWFDLILYIKQTFRVPQWQRIHLPCRTRGLQCRRHGFDPWVGKIPWSRKWQPTQVFLPEESQGQRSLVGDSPWGHKELDTTEHSAWPCCAHHARISLTGHAASSPRTEHEAGSKTELNEQEKTFFRALTTCQVLCIKQGFSVWLWDQHHCISRELVQSLNSVKLLVRAETAAHQASLSFTIS